MLIMDDVSRWLVKDTPLHAISLSSLHTCALVYQILWALKCKALQSVGQEELFLIWQDVQQQLVLYRLGQGPVAYKSFNMHKLAS